MKRILKDKKAITLIALVITIVVLVILAAVTISMTVGNDGLIAKAIKAANDYKNAQEKDKQGINDLYGELVVAADGTIQNLTLERLEEIINKKISDNNTTLNETFDNKISTAIQGLNSSDENNELTTRITNLENKSNSLGKTLYTGNFNSGSITVADFNKYSYLIAICDWGWAIPLYKESASSGYMYGIGGRGGQTSTANDRCIMALSLSYSGNTITYIEGKYGFLNGSNNNTNLSVKKLIGIY